MRKPKLSPLDLMLAQEAANKREEVKAAVSTALVPIDDNTLSPTRALIALDATQGNVSEAADILAVRPKELRAYIKANKQLRETLEDYRLRIKDKAEANLAGEILAGDWAASIYYLNRQQRRDEVAPPKPTELKDHSFEELETMQAQVLEAVAKQLPKEVLLKLLADKTRH